MKLVPKLNVEAGGEWLVPFAKRQLARLAKLRDYGMRYFDIGTNQITLRWAPVWQSIKIAGALERFIAGWGGGNAPVVVDAPEGTNVYQIAVVRGSSIVTRSAKALVNGDQPEDYAAMWSKDLSTWVEFGAQDGDQIEVLLHRVVPVTDATPTGVVTGVIYTHEYHEAFDNRYVAISADGTRVVIRQSGNLGLNALRDTGSLFVIGEWNGTEWLDATPDFPPEVHTFPLFGDAVRRDNWTEAPPGDPLPDAYFSIPGPVASQDRAYTITEGGLWSSGGFTVETYIAPGYPSKMLAAYRFWYPNGFTLIDSVTQTAVFPSDPDEVYESRLYEVTYTVETRAWTYDADTQEWTAVYAEGDEPRRDDIRATHLVGYGGRIFVFPNYGFTPNDPPCAMAEAEVGGLEADLSQALADSRVATLGLNTTIPTSAVCGYVCDAAGTWRELRSGQGGDYEYEIDGQAGVFAARYFLGATTAIGSGAGASSITPDMLNIDVLYAGLLNTGGDYFDEEPLLLDGAAWLSLPGRVYDPTPFVTTLHDGSQWVEGTNNIVVGAAPGNNGYVIVQGYVYDNSDVGETMSHTVGYSTGGVTVFSASMPAIDMWAYRAACSYDGAWFVYSSKAGEDITGIDVAPITIAAYHGSTPVGPFTETADGAAVEMMIDGPSADTDAVFYGYSMNKITNGDNATVKRRVQFTESPAALTLKSSQGLVTFDTGTGDPEEPLGIVDPRRMIPLAGVRP